MWAVLGNDYRQTSNISRILVDNKIVDPSDVVGASLIRSRNLPILPWKSNNSEKNSS